MNDGARLLVFVRFPERGKVKTRLARSVGHDAALALYRCFVADAIALSRKSGRRLLVFYDPPGSREAMIHWLGSDLTYVAQAGSDLGGRMDAAFLRAFQDCMRAVLIGSDCPDLPPVILDEAFTSLESHDVVIGPSVDGGYYLIGLSSTAQVLPAIFQGIDWGSSTVFEATLKSLARNGADVHILPRWRDIDERADLAALLSRQSDLPRGRLLTVDYLRDHGFGEP